MMLTAFKALAAPIYDVTFRAFVKLIELNVVPDFIIRTGVRALLQTRLDLVRLSRHRNASRTTSTQLSTRRTHAFSTRYGRRCVAGPTPHGRRLITRSGAPTRGCSDTADCNQSAGRVTDRKSVV